jgi:hypothetical protein
MTALPDNLTPSICECCEERRGAMRRAEDDEVFILCDECVEMLTFRCTTESEADRG